MNRICYLFLICFQFVSLTASADFCSRPDLPENYKKDCKLKSDFQTVESCFKSKGKNIDNVQVYRALRLIDRKDYNLRDRNQNLDLE